MLSCTREPNDTGEKQPEHKTAVISVSNDYWAYFSFEKGEIIGTGRLGFQEDDEAWRVRSDWDFAICRDMIRTNSGTSGEGTGGIIRMESTAFSHIDHAPWSGYQTDRDDIIIQ